MLILEPDIKPYWTAHGVRLVAHTTLYLNTPDDRGKPVRGDRAISIYVTIMRGGIERGCTANPTITLAPEPMAAIDSWIQAQDLMAVWEKEEANYKAVVGTIELPGVRVDESICRMSYDIPISTPEWAAPLLVKVEVDKKGAKGTLYIHGSHGSYYYEQDPLSEFDLQYPITMDGIRDKVRGTLQAYMDHL